MTYRNSWGSSVHRSLDFVFDGVGHFWVSIASLASRGVFHCSNSAKINSPSALHYALFLLYHHYLSNSPLLLPATQTTPHLAYGTS